MNHVESGILEPGHRAAKFHRQITDWSQVMSNENRIQLLVHHWLSDPNSTRTFPQEFDPGAAQEETFQGAQVTSRQRAG